MRRNRNKKFVLHLGVTATRVRRMFCASITRNHTSFLTNQSQARLIGYLWVVLDMALTFTWVDHRAHFSSHNSFCKWTATSDHTTHFWLNCVVKKTFHCHEVFGDLGGRAIRIYVQFSYLKWCFRPSENVYLKRQSLWLNDILCLFSTFRLTSWENRHGKARSKAPSNGS